MEVRATCKAVHTRLRGYKYTWPCWWSAVGAQIALCMQLYRRCKHTQTRLSGRVGVGDNSNSLGDLGPAWHRAARGQVSGLPYLGLTVDSCEQARGRAGPGVPRASLHINSIFSGLETSFSSPAPCYTECISTPVVIIFSSPETIAAWS